ncbi:TerB family tellurite resistance protein [Hydrogenophaga sp.]|uniref:tellurite resistance TerB family protein n=1 Tax=Hydrogenophaga sp. TaxID=1904254 RepID=UPI0025BC3A01|nr:TerB family tellurite resistance protein [Hydrogenophaga sp.]
MLKLLQDFLTNLTEGAPTSSPQEQEHQLQLATAVLLVEVLRAEPTLDAAERATVVTALHNKFSLRDDEIAALIELAQDTAQTAYDYQRFTSQLNERFTQDQKIRVVEAMWRVAYADAHLDAHENHVISKVAGLLHVTHGEYIAAKLRAKETAGLS